MIAPIVSQLLPFGQHSTVVFAASTIQVASDSQQKLSGRPDCAHFENPEAQVPAALSKIILGLIYVAEAVMAKTAVRCRTLRGPQRYGMS